MRGMGRETDRQRRRRQPRALLVDDPRFDAHAAPGLPPGATGAARGGPRRGGAARGTTLPPRSTARGRRPTRSSPASTTRASSRRSSELRGESGLPRPRHLRRRARASTSRASAGRRRSSHGRRHARRPRRARASRCLRPPGHHARPAHAMGFCLLNNVAVAAAHARARGLAARRRRRLGRAPRQRHAGDVLARPARALRLDAPVPVLPGHGRRRRDRRGRGQGLHGQRAARGRRRRRRLRERRSSASCSPVLEAYAPELVLVSAGFDAAARDPLAQMELSPHALRLDGAAPSRASPTASAGGPHGPRPRGRLRPRRARGRPRRGDARRIRGRHVRRHPVGSRHVRRRPRRSRRAEHWKLAENRVRTARAKRPLASSGAAICSAPFSHGGRSSVGRALDCGSSCRGFEPRRSPQSRRTKKP